MRSLHKIDDVSWLDGEFAAHAMRVHGSCPGQLLPQIATRTTFVSCSSLRIGDSGRILRKPPVYFVHCHSWVEYESSCKSSSCSSEALEKLHWFSSLWTTLSSMGNSQR